MNSKHLVTLFLLTCFLAIPSAPAAEPQAPVPNKLVIHADQAKDTISRNIYGQFSEHLGHCIYEGVWVGQDSTIPNTRGIRHDVVAALHRIQIPVLRWPGGCFADEYHWRDGVGPYDQRPTMVNTHWGGVTENNHFGTHEFLDFCAQLGCEPYICGNVGSGTSRKCSNGSITSPSQASARWRIGAEKTAASSPGLCRTSVLVTRIGGAAEA